MRFSTPIFASVIASTLVLGAARPSLAQYNNQYPYPGAPQPNPAPPPTAAAPNGEYVAPLAQQTQQVYIPQSVALSGPRMIKDWDETQPIPPGYHRETRVRKGMLIAGALVFGIPYLYSGMIASLGEDLAPSGSENHLAALYIPCLGPFIEMGQTDTASGRYVLALDGLAQSAGAFMFIYSLVAPRQVLVRNDLALLTVMPVKMGKDGQGLGFIGTF